MNLGQDDINQIQVQAPQKSLIDQLNPFSTDPQGRTIRLAIFGGLTFLGWRNRSTLLMLAGAGGLALQLKYAAQVKEKVEAAKQKIESVDDLLSRGTIRAPDPGDPFYDPKIRYMQPVEMPIVSPKVPEGGRWHIINGEKVWIPFSSVTAFDG